MNNTLKTAHDNYVRVTQAIEYLAAHQLKQPQLNEVAAHVGLSEHHLQRTFTQWAGVSPKQYLQYLTKEYAKQALKEQPVLDAAITVGLSGSSRLYDLMLKFEHATPGEIRNGGKDLEIRYATHYSPFGYCFIAVTHRGICKLSFYDHPDSYAETIDELESEWPNADLIEDSKTTKELIQTIFNTESNNNNELSILCKGTEFQTKVWEALINLPPATLQSYQQIAMQIKQPTAVRAVATAIASNKVALLIPCHRVIRATGELNHYRWGKTRKAAMIGWEKSSLETGN